MTPDVLGGGEGAPSVLLRSPHDDVDLGEEEQHEGDSGAERDGDGHGHLLVLPAEVDGEEPQPDDAGGVHGEPDKLGLVEVLRQVPRLDGVQRAHEDEEEVEAERDDDAQGGGVAHESHAPGHGVIHLGVGRLDNQHDAEDDALDADDDAGDDDLRRGAHEAGLLGHDSLAAFQDPGDAVGPGDQSPVHQREGQSRHDPRQIAEDGGRFGHQQEVAGEGQRDAQQQDVGELPGGGLDDGGVVGADKDGGDPGGEEQAHAGQGRHHDGARVSPRHELHGNLVAVCTHQGGACLLVGCLTSQQQASVSQGRICSDNFTCCHT